MKILAIITAVLILWFGYPHLKRGEWIAPNPLPPASWTLQIDRSGYARALATPPEGYGWRSFALWRAETPPSGRPVQEGDFRW